VEIKRATCLIQRRIERKAKIKSKGRGPCLYDLKNDPNQNKNVVKDFPGVAKDLRRKLQNHLKIEAAAQKLRRKK
jgi:hypothetical protein